jgi:hypothetical protein
MRNIKLKPVAVAVLATLIVNGLASGGWCKVCTALPYCPNGINSMKESWCGSYDNASPQGCWSYFKRLRLCPIGDPGDPPVEGSVVRTEWRLGFVCVGDQDCM